MADLAKIKRNVAKMVGQNAPETDIDAYIGSEGVRLDAVRSFKGGSATTKDDADFAEKMGAGGMGLRLADSLSLGAFTPVSSAIGAAGKTAIKAVTGQPTDFVGDYTRERDTQDELLRRSRDGGGLPGHAAELALSLPFMGGKAALDAAGSALAPVARSTFQRFVTDPAKAGAAYGAVYGANSARGGIGEHVEGTAIGGASGAILGPALHGGMNMLARVPGAVNQGWRKVTGRSADNVAENARIADEMQAAGITPFGPAIADQGAGGFAARGLANSMVGGRVRGGAERTIGEIEGAAQNALSRHTDGRPVNDLGAETQQTLRHNLAERSRSRDELARMPPDEIARITGPIDERGFSPPPPRVDPIQPRPVAPIRPDPVDPFQVPFEAVRPRPVKRGEVKPSYPSREDAPVSTRLVQEVEAANRTHAVTSAEMQTAGRRFDELAAQAGESPEVVFNTVNVQFNRNKYGPEVAKAFDDLVAMQKATDEARRRVEFVQRSVELERDKTWRQSVKEAHTKAEHEVETAYMREQQVAAREANEATQAQRTAAVRAEEIKRAEAAAEQTARARAESEAEAIAATQRAQAKAQAEHEATRETRPGFETGRSRETYPTEFDAAYEQLNRNTPTFQRNPMGGRGMSGSDTPTATEGLMHELALQARASGKLKGYKGTSVFGETGVPRPEFLAVMEKSFGREVSDLLQTSMLQRAKGQPTGGPQALRDLNTAVRRAKQEAQRVGTSPLYPGQPMPERAANLARLEGVLKEDYHRFMRETGPGGERLSGMVRNVDAQYGKHLDDMRKPLAKIFGDKVEPMQAMDRLVKAANDGDLSVLRPFMRVLNEKAEPMKGVAAILTHATGGARTIDDFVKGYRGLSKDALDVMMTSDASKALRGQLDTLARYGEMMQPYSKAIGRAKQGGVRVEHLPAVGAIAMGHALPLLAVYGGASVTSRFLSSPRYVRWLTEAARVRTPLELEKHVAKLAFMTGRDTESGADIRKAASRLLSATTGIKPAHAMFVGEGAAEADRAALDAAKQAHAEGKAPDAIWKQHGWMLQPDGKWRSEIDDSGAKLTAGSAPMTANKGRTALTQELTVGDVVAHDALFASYPELSRIKIVIDPKIRHFAHYDNNDDSLTFGKRALQTPEYFRSVLLHELQHAIAQREGFAYGRPAVGDAGYGQRPGEVEAFTTEMRGGMSAAARRQLPPWMTSPALHGAAAWNGALPLPRPQASSPSTPGARQ